MNSKLYLHGIFALLLFFIPVDGFSQELCTNGIDDDGDGLVDLNDTTDCFCVDGIVNEIANLIPNPSFEETNCCPDFFFLMNCAQDWFQATQATTDYMNNCDFMPSIFPQPLPDGDGIVGAAINTLDGGSYSEYLGACLQTPMVTGEEYSFDFSVAGFQVDGYLTETYPITVGPVDLVLYGKSSCAVFPEPFAAFPLATENCQLPDDPAWNGWYVLGSVNYQPESEWSVQTIDFTVPQMTEAIMLGSPCINDESFIVEGEQALYFVYDGLALLDPLQTAEIEISGGNCVDDLILSAVESELLTYQWFFEGVALSGENSSSLNLGISDYQEGVYQVLLTHSENGTCGISEIEVIADSEESLVDFEANALSGCVPLEVSFTNLTDPNLIGSNEWSIGSETSSEDNPSFSLTEVGTYTVTLTVETPDGCTSGLTKENYIEVYANPQPEISYEVLQGCDSFLLAFESNAPGSSIFSWNFESVGTSSEPFPLQTFNSEGIYNVELGITNSLTGCSGFDTALIELTITNPASFDIIAPHGLCANSGVDSLEAIYQNGTINWLGGGSGTYLQITEPGTYTAIFTRDDGCKAIDSISVPLKDLPSLSSSDVEACHGDIVYLVAESNVIDVTWRDVSETGTAIITEEGFYIAEAENECGMTQIEVEVSFKDCSCNLYVPNSFTPNSDGINDIFKPVFDCELQYYELRIFNRWGEEVFLSKDPFLGWNGNSERHQDYYGPSGVYNYILWYDNALRPLSDRQKVRGTVQMLR